MNPPDDERATLLIVEDDPVLLEAMREILENAGYDVWAATNGDAALESLRDGHPNLILSATTLPGMSGFELFDSVSERTNGEVPFLFIMPSSSHDAFSANEPLISEGHIKKPITSHKLLNAVQTRLRQAEDAKSALERAEQDSVSILVVEDDLAMLIALQDILEGAGYIVSTATNGEEALYAFRDHNPALVLSDISMPVMDGIELFEAVRKLPGGTAVPFIFLTARHTRQDVLSGMSLGADDYITKPVTSQELLTAVHARLKRADEILLAQLRIAYKASLMALANAIEARDQYTHEHVMRTNAYAQAIARELGWSESEREILEFGAILHDIGKLEVPVTILQKEEPLTPEEWEQMRKHPVVGGHMIEGIDYLAPSVPIILHHHECWDGSGYPDGLKEEDIPSGARLLAVVDTFEAMTTDRPYRDAIHAKIAYQEILSRSGRQFDPRMVEAFKRCWKRGVVHKIMQSSERVKSAQQRFDSSLM